MPYNLKIGTNCISYLEQFPEIGTIEISTDSRKAIIGLQDIGCESLLKLIGMMSAEELNPGSNKRWRIQDLAISEVDRSFVKQLGLKFFPNCYQSSQAHLKDICEWIDLSLHLNFVRNFSSDNEVNTPGWAMSAARARLLLGNKYADEGEVELTRFRDGLEEKMNAFETTNRRGVGASKYVVLFDAFSLNKVEREILLFTFASELDGRYARIYGYLNDDLTRRRPTPSILKQLIYSEEQLAWDIQQLLHGNGSLAAYQLVTAEPNDTLPGSDVELKLAPEILAYLLSESESPTSYGSCLDIIYADHSKEGDSSWDNCQLKEKFRRWRDFSLEDSRPIIQILGGDESLRWFGRISNEAGESVVILNLPAQGEVNEYLSVHARGSLELPQSEEGVWLVRAPVILPTLRYIECHQASLARTINWQPFQSVSEFLKLKVIQGVGKDGSLPHIVCNRIQAGYRHGKTRTTSCRPTPK